MIQVSKRNYENLWSPSVLCLSVCVIIIFPIRNETKQYSNCKMWRRYSRFKLMSKFGNIHTFSLRFIFLIWPYNFIFFGEFGRHHWISMRRRFRSTIELFDLPHCTFLEGDWYLLPGFVAHSISYSKSLTNKNVEKKNCQKSILVS